MVMSKCRGIADLAVMEMAQVGVTTRARAALAMGATATNSSAERSSKKRKINNDEGLKVSPSSSSFVQIKGRSHDDVIQPELEDRCYSLTSDQLPASCCSSNGSIGLDEERIEFVDLEVDSAQVETSTCNSGDERREMSPSSELRPNSPTETNTRCISTDMPSDLELEEFFASAENDIQKRFAEKYNYDIAKDVPLEGRYEWVQIKP
ncbi:cyclin-dependent kinase inhibitor 7-like [Senna tora]|uniref:Cyclin-dependent kinase inhibitor n=1 Tax=Senna tora TaxID=362788 RepID=A0A834SW60_9FABA|nr:cyclin-dependent kinase inhibitor 7-like [Senna tora]